MSNALAIAAVTRTLADLLEGGFKAFEQTFSNVADVTASGFFVTTLPLDESNKTNDKRNAVNLFLYHAQASPTWRNTDLPTTRPNESAAPLLGLDLFYLLTAYGVAHSDRSSHVPLGQAMSVLHDHPLLARSHLERILAKSRVHEQVERIRITPQPLSLDEMSKLWTTFQTQYRPSVAYAVSVVLIESTRPARAALPVLTRGSEDGGAFVVASRAPTLASVVPPHSQSSAQLGDDLTVTGDGLDAKVRVRMRSRYFDAPIELDPRPGGSSSERHVHLPSVDEDAAAMANWTPGFFTADVAAETTSIPGRSLASNEVAWALAPRITVAPPKPNAGAVVLTVTCAPRLRDERPERPDRFRQRVLLLLSRRSPGGEPDEQEYQVEITSKENPESLAAPTKLTFRIPKLVVGQYQVRLRVDGVDSIPAVRREDTGRFQFDERQMIEVVA